VRPRASNAAITLAIRRPRAAWPAPGLARPAVPGVGTTGYFPFKRGSSVSRNFLREKVGGSSFRQGPALEPRECAALRFRAGTGDWPSPSSSTISRLDGVG
jgi:hypothetical protein